MYPSSSSDVATDDVILLFLDRYPWGVWMVWSMGVDGSEDCDVLDRVRPRAAPPHDCGLGELCKLIWRLGRVVFMADEEGEEEEEMSTELDGVEIVEEKSTRGIQSTKMMPETRQIQRSRRLSNHVSIRRDSVTNLSH